MIFPFYIQIAFQVHIGLCIETDYSLHTPSPQGNLNQSTIPPLHELPALTAPPKAGDFIALKTVVMEQCYSLTLSDYQVAKVLAVEGLCVKLKFVESANIQTLTMEEINGDDLEENTRIKEMDWRDIVEPRVLFSV
ncbi:hypothetical protein GWK47_047654 [Chionoecetes opilio]|uniref:Coilin tudor domain-containing protein n=1 Tax=Chionoecetes opilio TaxID=41210 RepID=A0A8J4YAY5_CHIOP|nr:hypothetical protein GWK47_047654 [Chionoecetes opilio]